jgi:hypothetical protein
MNKTVLTTLLDISDETFAKYILKQDMLYNKVNQKELLSLIRRAMNCGKEVAKQIKKDYNVKKVDDYLASMNIQVEEKNEEGISNFICFGAYTPPNKITVYNTNTKKAQSIIGDKNFPELVGTPFVDVIKAHELFHHIEVNDETLFVNKYKIPLWKVFGYIHKSRLTALSEIAGMSFAKELLQLEYNPTALNVILLYPYHPEEALLIYREIISIR